MDFACAPWNRKETVSSRVIGRNSSAEQILGSTARVSVLVISENLDYEWGRFLSFGPVCSLSVFWRRFVLLVQVLQSCACGLEVEGDHLELGVLWLLGLCASDMGSTFAPRVCRSLASTVCSLSLGVSWLASVGLG